MEVINKVLNKKNKFFIDKFKLLGIVLIFIIFNVIINVFDARVSNIYILKFTIFEVLLFYLPGLAAASVIKWKKISVIELIAVTNIMGYSINIMMYLTHMILGIPLLLANIFLILISLYMLLKNKNYLYSIYNENKKNEFIFIFILICMLVMQFFLFFQLNKLPYFGNGNEYYSDFLYWIGDANELSIQFPPTHFRDPGQIYRYHYFSAMQLSYTNMVVGLGNAKVAFLFSYINPIILLLSSSFMLFKRATKNNFLIWIGIIILLLTTGHEGNTSVNWISHMYKCSFGFDVSIAFFMLSLSWNYDYLLENMSDIKYFIFQSIILVITLGLKSVTGMCMMLVLGLICLYKLIIKKKRVRYILVGVLFLMIFLFVYATVLSTFNTQYANTVSSSKLTINWFKTSLFRNPIPAGYYQSLINMGLPTLFAQIWMMVRYSLWCHFPVFSLFYLGIIISLVFYKKLRYIDLVTGIIPIIGLISLFLFDHDQYSQMYFMLCVYPSAAFFSLLQLDKIINFLQRRGVKNHIIIGTLSLYCIYGVYTFSQQYYFHDFIGIGINNYFNPQSIDVNPSVENHMMQPVSKKEYEAYEWIRLNTDNSDQLLSNFVFSNFQRNYSLGAFSERHVILDDKLLTSVFNSEKNIEHKLKKSNIQYIVMIKWIGDENIPSNIATNVYQNEEVKIYEVNK